MNGLIQLDSLLIGTEEDAVSLESRDSVRLLVLSDSHGHTDVVEEILREFGPSSDALLFAGDGCADIAECISRASRSEQLRDALPPVIALVRGNGDAEKFRVVTGSGILHPETAEDLEGYPIQVTDRQLLRAGGRKVLLTHGNRLRVDTDFSALISTAGALDCDMIFYGHTHKPHWEEDCGSLILNPGSCALPRGGMPPTFAVVEFPGSDRRFDVTFYEIQETFSGYRFARFTGI